MIKSLIEIASHLNKLNTNNEALYEYINLNKPNLKEVLETYKPTNEFKPVNTLRFLIANELEKGNLINHNKIEELKQALEDRDVSSYYQFNNIVLEKLTNYKNSKKGMFPNWRQAYKVLFPFIHNSSENEETKTQLIRIANEIIKINELKNVSKHIVTFQGAQNYGTDRVWLAIIPKSASSVQNAYQLFFTIDNNGISGGIHKGHNLPKDNFINENLPFATIEDYVSYTKEVKEEWSRLNSEANHFLSFSQIEEKFEAFLYKSVAEGTAKTYLSAIRSIEKLSKNEGIEIKSIYQFTDSVSFKDFSENLKQIDTYNKTNAKHHNRYSSALLKYEEFLAYNSKNTMFEKNNTPQPLNQILFGPPGTGKTYETIKKAVQITNPNFDINQSRDLIKAEYDRLVEKGLIVFTTFHQSMSYEDFIEGIKPKVSEKDEITYTVKDGIFKELCEKASKRNLTIKNSSFDERFQKLKDEWEESDNSELVIEMTKSEFTITKISNNNIFFNKKSGSNKHDLVISTLKDLYEEKRIMKSGLASYYYPVIDKLKSYQIENKNNKADNFVLIIDEINRGNVSAIFGELITLLENTKRSGNNNLEALKAKLPYSKEDLTVPNNLYVIGTMNTADRSVEALDTALRRRFHFEEKMPDYKLLDELKSDLDIDLRATLEKINKRIEVLLDREHQIGHSYLLNIKNENQLLNAFKNKIIPLLQEYFYNDYDKIGLVLGNEFIYKKTPNNIFANYKLDYKNELLKDIYTWIELSESNIIEKVKSIYTTKESND